MSDTFIFKPNVKYEFNKKNNGIRVQRLKSLFCQRRLLCLITCLWIELYIKQGHQ